MARRRRKADYRVRFDNECPRLGSGVRGITVVQVGRKWVRIRETATERSAKLARRVWDEMEKV